jgi:hypothetical protein
MATHPRLNQTHDELVRREFVGVWDRPRAMLRGRMSGFRAALLKPVAANDSTATGGDRASGEPQYRVCADQLSRAAVVLGLVGALGAVHVLPSTLLAIVVGAFLLAGPGSLLLSWYTHLPIYAVVALLPAVSVAVCVLVVAVALMLGIYNPVWVLLGLTSATAVGGLLRNRYLAHHERAVQ